MAKGLPKARRRRRSTTGPDPAEVLWELDAGTPEQAWTTPWATWRAPARLAFEAARLDPGHQLRSLRGFPFTVVLGGPESTDAYERLQDMRRALPYTEGIEARQQGWLVAACLIAEAGIANSSGGGMLYGSLMLELASRYPDERLTKALEDARVRDALGRYGERLAASAAAFRNAWRAGRYRLAYALARAARGLP